MVRRADAFNLLGSVAEKALAMGRADEAERLLASPLADVVEASRAGKRLSPWLVDMAARFAAKLATCHREGGVGRLRRSSSTTRRLRPCPGPVIDELYNAFRKVNAIDLVRLRGYVAHLREKQASLRAGGALPVPASRGARAARRASLIGCSGAGAAKVCQARFAAAARAMAARSVLVVDRAERVSRARPVARRTWVRSRETLRSGRRTPRAARPRGSGGASPRRHAPAADRRRPRRASTARAPTRCWARGEAVTPSCRTRAGRARRSRAPTASRQTRVLERGLARAKRFSPARPRMATRASGSARDWRVRRRTPLL